MSGSSGRRRPFRRVVSGMLAVVVALGLGVSGGVAQATPQIVSSSVDGVLAVAPGGIDLTGAVFEGSWDPATGDLEGGFVVPATTTFFVPEGPNWYDVQIEQDGAGTGFVDLDTNEAHLNADLVLRVVAIHFEDGFTDALQLCDYDMPVEMTGTFDPSTGVVSLSDTGISTTPALGVSYCWSNVADQSYGYVTDELFVNAATTFDAAVDLGTQLPGAPTIIRNATAGNAQATASWTAPTSDGGSPITGYIVTPYVGYKPQPSQTFNTTTTTQTLTGLANGTQYRFRVQAINAIGASGSSTVTNPVVPTAPTSPGAPTILRNATAGDGEATASWITPSSDGGSPITGYVVTPYVGYAPQPSQTFNTTVTTQTLTGLTNGTQYRLRVQAINAVGASGFSTVTNPVVPNA